MSILVLGTAALDTVKTPFGKRVKMLGGSAVHFSMSSRLFTPVHLVAVVGKDFPQEYTALLKRKGLVLDALIRAEGPTFHWEGEYRGDMNVAITKKTELGVLGAFCPVITEAQRKIKNVFLANVDPDIQSSLLRRMDRPRLVALDSMNYWIDTKRAALLKVLKEVTIYVANDQEARSLSGEHNLIKAAKALRKLGPKMILLKKGEHGVMFYCDDFIINLPAYPTENVVDPTGAGDTFAGGFMGYLCRTSPLTVASVKKALVYGTLAASFNVEAFGLERTKELKFGDIEKRFAAFKKIAAFS